MNDYDFSTLNDKEFENLTIDLISRDRGKRFERFKAGRDGGIDGRYYGEDGKEEIIQCKHYLKTGNSGLISSLKKKNNGKNEVDKVKILNPEKYIFVTSLPLSATNKKEIKELFEPYIKSDSDIYGQEDLNDLLKANPDIEEKYYKLWISSTTVLQRIFNNAIKSRSEFLLDEIKEKIKYYVITENHNKAIKKLEESHTIIIAGEPGIGKTTLAEQISLYYIEKGFKFCVIAKDISEAEAIFERDKKQIFYFDDFLGSNYLNALEAHTDSHIMQFITSIKKDKDKRFILTSRTNIFNQSILSSDEFRTKKLDSDEFIITVDELTEINKAKILYNHLWHSNLSEEYIDELYKDKRYKEIIKHKNFNPRLIEFITDIDRIRSNSATTYWQDIQNNLDNPREIWANTFDRQSDEYIRNIVSLVVFNGNSIEEEELKEAYYRLNNLMDLQNSSHTSKEFDNVIEETVKYFLNRRLRDNEVEYSLFNPSIADYVINKYIKNKRMLSDVFSSLSTNESLELLESLKDKIKYNEIVNQLYINLDIDFFINKLGILSRFLYLIDVTVDKKRFYNTYKEITFIEKFNKKFDLNFNLNRLLKFYRLIDEKSYIDNYIDFPLLTINDLYELKKLYKNNKEVYIKNISNIYASFEIEDAVNKVNYISKLFYLIDIPLAKNKIINSYQKEINKIYNAGKDVPDGYSISISIQKSDAFILSLLNNLSSTTSTINKFIELIEYLEDYKNKYEFNFSKCKKYIKEKLNIAISDYIERQLNNLKILKIEDVEFTYEYENHIGHNSNGEPEFEWKDSDRPIVENFDYYIDELLEDINASEYIDFDKVKEDIDISDIKSDLEFEYQESLNLDYLSTDKSYTDNMDDLFYRENNDN